MPELPEVETVRRGLAERVLGDRIKSVWCSRKPEPFKSSPREIRNAVEGARIEAVGRMGKHIVLELSRQSPGEKRSRPMQDDRRRQPNQKPAKGGRNAPTAGETRRRQVHLVFHLGMSGALQVVSADSAAPLHTHARLSLASGREIRFVDPRRFGRISVSPQFNTHGIEPLEMEYQAFSALFRACKAPIKSALLNQKLLRGVGNIYADESLFRAGIRPRRRSNSLTRDELRRLFDAVRKVLRAAIAAGGSSISDYFDVEGEPGWFQTQHRVYGRQGRPCLVCRTPIKRLVLAGRSAHYCPQCQK